MPGGTNIQRVMRDAQVRRWLWPGMVLSVAALLLAVMSIRMMRGEWGSALAGDKPGPEEFARWGTFWATTINAILLGAGALFVAVAKRAFPCPPLPP